MNKNTIKSNSWMFLVACFTTACGGVQRGNNSEAPVIEMEPMVVKASDGQVTEMYDAQSLFEEAQRAYAMRNYAECAEKHVLLIKTFTESRYFAASLYNCGLCYEKIKKFSEAEPYFRRYVSSSEKEKDRLDGLFHRINCLTEMQSYDEAIELCNVLLKGDLAPSDQAEAYLRRGAAFLGKEDFSASERDLRKSVDRVREIYAEYLRGNDLLAEGYYLWGKLYQTLSHRAEIKMSPESLKTPLNEKIRLFKQAQRHYISAISVQNAEFSAAAGYQLGELYEEFADDIYAIKPPEDFDQETQNAYFMQLDQVLQPVWAESLDIYQKNIEMIDRLGGNGQWREQTEQRLQRLMERLPTQTETSK